MKGRCRSSNLCTAGVAGTSNYILMAACRPYLVTCYCLCADPRNLLTFFFTKESLPIMLCVLKIGRLLILQLSHALGSDEVSLLSATSDWMLLFFRNFQRSLIYTTTAPYFVLLFVCGKGHVTEVTLNKKCGINVVEITWDICFNMSTYYNITITPWL
jgi:hypothetical protein